MNNIETLIVLILLLMAVPDVCRKLGRPAMANILFVVFGLVLGIFLGQDVATTVQQAGKVGFLLVLFEVGLEINLPKLAEFLPSLRFALVWFLVQLPLLMPLAHLVGLSWGEGFLAAAALTGCSMSMAFPGWKHFKGLEGPARVFSLQVMVAMEVLAIVTMTISSVALHSGMNWMIGLKLGAMAVTVFLISRAAAHVSKLCEWIIGKTTHWRVHFLVLLVLGICALGERLGLAAPKTAFFMGLFMSRTEFHGRQLEEYIAPISRRFLIPIFFISLGLTVQVKHFLSYGALVALCGAFVVIGFREVLHRRWLKSGGPGQTFLLFSPNLTIAALAAAILMELGRPDAAIWVTMCGLFFSVISLWLLPPTGENESAESH